MAAPASARRVRLNPSTRVTVSRAANVAPMAPVIRFELFEIQ